MAVNQALQEPRGSLRNCPSQTPGGVLMSGPLELSGVLLLWLPVSEIVVNLRRWWADCVLTLTLAAG